MEIKNKYSFQEFIDIVTELRSDHGCPWDKKQTHMSLVSCLMEESTEVKDAIKNEDMENLCEELGDLLLQVVMHAQIASENKYFNIEDVITGISQKMIRRHPHVFGNLNVTDEKELLMNWEQIKQQEKRDKTQ